MEPVRLFVSGNYLTVNLAQRFYCVSSTEQGCQPMARVRCMHFNGVVSHLTQEISVCICGILLFQD